MLNPLRHIINEVRAAFAQPKGVSLLDSLAGAIVDFSGNGFDPQGCTLPAYKPKQEPRAALPKKEKKVADLTNDDLLTEEEMRSWKYYGTGPGSDKRIQEALKDTKTSKVAYVDFDELPADMHGITEWEYGQMLAYSPPLKDTALAAKVKSMKPTKTLSEIAAILGEKEQLIRHYSSALGKANPSPRKK